MRDEPEGGGEEWWDRFALHPAPHPRLFQERRTHPAETFVFPSPNFRLIPRWNQTLVSGSFLDWKMLPSPGNIGADFARLDLLIWDELNILDVRNDRRRQQLD